VKAVRLVAVGRPLQMQEVSRPAMGERDVLVRVKAASICHSDAHYRAGALSDHLFSELPLLLKVARRGLLDLSDVITRTVSLDAHAINAALDKLERFGGNVRVVITP
jgi:Zn-dependent alcohol dehydrogenase